MFIRVLKIKYLNSVLEFFLLFFWVFII